MSPSSAGTVRAASTGPESFLNGACEFDEKPSAPRSAFCGGAALGPPGPGGLGLLGALLGLGGEGILASLLTRPARVAQREHGCEQRDSDDRHTEARHVNEQGAGDREEETSAEEGDAQVHV